MTISAYTVQLVDTTYGRIVLDEVTSDSAADAATAAVASPPVSGPNATYTAGQVINQKALLVVTGTDADGTAVVSPTSLPPVPAFVGNTATTDVNG